MHNAGTIAGMAFGNAFLGIVHAMAHTLGATFHIAHGRTNAVLLPHVIRYNGTVPSKLSGWPRYEPTGLRNGFRDRQPSSACRRATPAEGVASLRRRGRAAPRRGRHRTVVRRDRVDRAAYEAALPQQALNAYEDQCAPANPRMPMLDDMQQLMRDAYQGTPR